MSLLTTALTAQQHHDQSFHTDTDSFIIAIDNCASLCMMLALSDFIKPPCPSQMTITSMGGGDSNSITHQYCKMVDRG